MIKSIISIATTIIGAYLMVGSTANAHAAYYDSKTIGQVQIDTRPCVFFWINGVNEADPVVAGAKWFALPRSAVNFQEMMAVLLSSKLTNKPFYVTTDGTTNCGYATASLVGID